jgi:acyl carrier protein
MNIEFDAAEVTDDTSLGAGGLELESLALVELAMAVENEYKFKFPEEVPDGDQEFLVDVTLGQFVAETVRRQTVSVKA